MNITIAAIVLGNFLVFAGLVSAAASDLARRVIPNWFVLTVGAGGVILRLATASRHGVWTSLGAAVVLFVALRLLSGLSALGGGDVKLMTAVALGQSPVSMLPILLGIGVAGGAIAIFYLIRDWARRRDKHLSAGASWRQLAMPYAPAILAGVVWHELWGLVT
jgi:prepilin peptidase CpaA